MQLIKGIKEIWKRKVSLKDRLIFALILIIFLTVYFWTHFIRYNIPFADYQFSVYVAGLIILLIGLNSTVGAYVIRIWLIISSIIGKMVFTVLLFLIYFLLISPLFMVKNLFRKPGKGSTTNWKEPMLNKDYLNMG